MLSNQITMSLDNMITASNFRIYIRNRFPKANIRKLQFKCRQTKNQNRTLVYQKLREVSHTF